MTLAALTATAGRRDHLAPVALRPAREARVLDLAHIRRATMTTVGVRVVRRVAAAVTARALEHAASARSWWDRSVRKLAADVLRLPAIDGVPPRAARLLKSSPPQPNARPPHGGFAASRGGESS